MPEPSNLKLAERQAEALKHKPAIREWFQSEAALEALKAGALEAQAHIKRMREDTSFDWCEPHRPIVRF